ncbi:MAG TPA: aminoacyl-histidine dipeptidase [Flavobacteriaceae bacterium]|nr:aminoacyl-histidine dipeptidase [Flavobacteriaceae bacterium]
MNKEIRGLEPKQVWNNFADLNAVPRASKKEEEVIAFMKAFGEDLGLETHVDGVGNVVIRKPATKGMEDRKMVVLQSHLDMVHQKNNDTDFDFATQGIEMYVDGDWVKAKGTTLGADNGLGVAAIMTILQSDTIEHPALEALFTIDEETGMTGAKGLQSDFLKGEILLNLDTEEDDEIGIGCAGGVDLTATKSYNLIDAPSDALTYQIKVKGLQGGHSGMEIHKGLGNANKLLNRLLYIASEKALLLEIDGGGLRNAIPREAMAKVVVSEKESKVFLESLKEEKENILSEFKSLEPNMEVVIKEVDKTTKKVLAKDDFAKLTRAIYASYNGVFRMSPDVEGLVETSSNLARIVFKEGNLRTESLLRSSVESGKADLVNSIGSAYELIDAKVELSGDYPGWQPNMDSQILKVMDDLYSKIFGEKANVAACHAGLECGIIGDHYPGMEMISFGPTILGAHSPDERASISSTQKFWKYLQETLKNIPKK